MSRLRRDGCGAAQSLTRYCPSSGLGAAFPQGRQGDVDFLPKTGYNKRNKDTTVLEDITASKGKTAISSEIKETKEDKEAIAMKRKAFDAINLIIKKIISKKEKFNI